MKKDVHLSLSPPPPPPPPPQCLILHSVSKKSAISMKYLNQSIVNSCYDTDEDYSENNILKYTSFHNAVFAIYKECQTFEFSHSIVASDIQKPS